LNAEVFFAARNYRLVWKASLCKIKGISQSEATDK